ncbi:hydantoinase B/oxoprolinase family protein [Stenotrophomonas sp. MMGLT7]|uniref:hydantoinase B/oxoprolinase family protein n=1 Tax=Stenotrophomonas sp. MMGLT7 TaxID=2901227 RepID=UPI001E386F9F|nr:hydantoinase B/oxoprolinase family protein [Stenotrophomonas sp. MMGLT7]MCD7098790.1 hydantoinase B/oxoprolinase family protein [Stenotrophomonas sp. MMGLT7]
MNMSSTSIDTIALELMYHKFKATTEEMGIALGRTACSSYVRETHDFATALCTPEGRFFAYPAETGIALGIDQDCSAFIAAVGEIEEGDVLVTNHPYLAPGVGSHLPDINLLKPYFYDGRLVCYGWSFAHCADIGGGVPSSISPAFDTLFQEGLQIPPMKLARRGVVDEGFMALLRANSRIPDIVAGDLRAQLSALAVGERRVRELIAQHGLHTVLAAQRGLVEYGKSRARAVVRRHLPDGVYEFHDYMDDDYNTRIPVRLRCRMEVSDGKIHLDLAGTDPQLAAPFNVPTGGVRHPYLTSKLMHMLFTYDPGLPLNYGIFENVTVNVPAGTVMNPQMPAAVGIRHAGAIRFNDAVLGCLALADAGMAPAASGGTVIPLVVSQTSADGGSRRVAVVQALAGGAGATGRGDGANGRDRSLANINNTPSERSELELKVRVEQYALCRDSGGTGCFRGGVGVAYTLRMLEEGMEIMGRGLERFDFQPWGVAGGGAGNPSQVWLNAGTPEARDIGKFDRLRLKAGDTLTIVTPGGGGYGHPHDRDPQRVFEDVRLGLVSLESAREEYGVALTADGLEVDGEGTAALRARRPERGEEVRLGRVRHAWERVFDDALMTRMAIALLDVPASVRPAVRRELFETAVPGVSTHGARLLCAPDLDAAAARARLEQALDALDRSGRRAG